MNRLFPMLLCIALLLNGISHAQTDTECIAATIHIFGEDPALSVCDDPGLPTSVRFRTSTMGMPFGFLVTDLSGNILLVSQSDQIDLTAFSQRNIRVYAFSYIGNILARVGQNIANAPLASICYKLTSNSIDFTYVLPSAGNLTLTGGGTETFLCPGDGRADIVRFDSSGVAEGLFTYIVTDTNNIIISIPQGDFVNFEGAGAGISRVWGLAYTGSLLAQPGQNILTARLSSGCSTLSPNFLTINRDTPDGGTISTSGGAGIAYACPGDGDPDLIRFDSSGVSNSRFRYVVTDANNVILALPQGDAVDFENLGLGVARVWGLAYTGNITAQIGDDADLVSLSSDCFDLSDNFVTIIRELPDGGTVSTEAGENTVYVCPGDGIADLVAVDSSNTVGSNFTYLITDANNTILSIAAGDVIDFDAAGFGVCRIWGLAFSGDLTAMPGQNAATAALSSGCYDLSDNFVTVIRAETVGGQVRTEDGQTTVNTCPGDNLADVIQFDSAGVIGPNFTYIITDANNTITSIPGGDEADFNESAGERRVWGLAYAGELTAQIGDNAATTDLASGCFDLSDNFITVIREVPNGGTVSTEEGETSVTICPGDGNADVIRFDSAGVSNTAFTYVITDANNTILAVPGTDFADFDAEGEGVSRVWGLAYTGELTAQVGDNAATTALSDDCFDLSDNFITVIREVPEGGTVSTEDGDTEVFLCPGDGLADLIEFDSSGTSNTSYVYVITDENNVIIGLPTGDGEDFEGAGVGVSRVWGLAYTGNLTAQVGDNAATTALSDDCFDLSDNFITITRDNVVGGTVSTEDGETTVNTCPGDNLADVIQFDSAGVVGPNFTYIITDANNTITSIPGGDEADFNESAGERRVWGLAYAGDLTAQVGDNAATADLASGCFDLSDNFITVIREVPNGGTVSTEEGETSVTICPGDGNADLIRFDSAGVSNTAFTYVITDANNTILAVPGTDFADFDASGEGVSRVWGLAYTGELTAQVGDNAATTALSDDCFDLSDNFITVIREVPEGGTVNTEDGDTEVFLCPGDGLADLIEFDSSGTSNTSYVYVITDENNVIIGLPTGDGEDFEGAGVGVSRVWGLAYTGNLTAQVGDNAATTALSDDCFDLSDNFITITRDNVVGGTVSTEDGETTLNTCPGDNLADVIQFDSAGVVGPNFTYIITDANNTITSIPGGDEADFNSAAGERRVWGLAYAGELTAQIGDNAATADLASGCFDLSDNFIRVIREVPNGGTVSTEEGETSVTICPGDGNADVIRFDSAGVSNTAFTYVITDANNTILAVPGTDFADFDAEGEGVSRVWGLAYTGELTAQVGDNAATTALSDDCFDLSDNFITVIREVPEGGTVNTEDGDTEVFLCPGDGLADLIEFDSSGTSNTSYVYVITDENNVIVGLPAGDGEDFEGAGVGVSRVWGLAYTGNLTAQVGDNAATTALSDDCFDLSDNFITITRDNVVGGTVSTEDGETTINTCPGDNLADVIQFDSAGVVGPNFTYIITDANNTITSIPGGDEADFNSAAGERRVWGLAYAGELTAQIGDNAATADLASGCFDLSDNFITVIREVPNGGTVSTEEGETSVTICPGDGNADLIRFDSAGVSNTAFTYVITDANNTILAVPGTDFADFDAEGEGVSRVWGLAYTGELTAQVGDNAATTALSDDCFDLSDNFITVIREVPEGGTVNTEDGDTEVFLCPGDGLADLIEFDSSGTSNTSYVYVITDENNVIIGLPTGDGEDFEGAGVGVSLVWGLAYTGNLTAQVGDNAATTALSDDCFDLSDNFITITRDNVVGGTVSTEDGETTLNICPGDDLADRIRFDSAGVVGPNFTYVITDANNTILAVPPGDVADFNDMIAGDRRVWGLAYAGELTAQVGDNAATTDLASGCFDLSDNFITVIREVPEGGTVSTEDGDTSVNTCPTSDVADVVNFDSTGVSNTPYTYVITDLNNTILALPMGDSFDFNLAAEGTYRVWGLAYTGSITASIGDVASAVALSDDCFDLSDNFITVIHELPNGGRVFTESGETQFFSCPGDGMPDWVKLDSVGASNAPYLYVVTDTNNVILSVSTADSLNFENSALGVCRVWGLAYTGNITAAVGDTASLVALSDDCFDLSDNFITVIKGELEGGRVSITPGLAVRYLCPADGQSDLVRFDSTGSSGPNFRYLLTDESNLLVRIINGDSLNFANVPEGRYRVRGLTYGGLLTAMAGQDVTSEQLATGCFGLSSNFATVISVNPVGGRISTAQGDTLVKVCAGDGLPDLISFAVTGAVVAKYSYVITDEDGFVVGTLDNSTFNFENSSAGDWRIYGVSYTGNLLILPGDNLADTPVAGGCYDLTDNFITLEKDQVDGGTVFAGGSSDTIYVCVGDGVPDVINFAAASTANEADYRFILTNNTNLVLRVIEGDSLNFETTGFNELRLYGVSFTGNLLVGIGDNITTDDISDECSDLSDNFVTVIRTQPNGGVLSFADGTDTTLLCIGRDAASVVVNTSSNSRAGKAYLITDTLNRVLEVITDGDVNFNDYQEGSYRIWLLSYTGDLLVQTGTIITPTAFLASSCFDLSDNFLRLRRGPNVDGGTLNTQRGMTTVFTCPGGDPDPIQVLTTSFDTTYRYVITDTLNRILVNDIVGNIIDFNAAVPGIYRIYGISHRGQLIIPFGANVLTSDLSNSCYDVSDNFITVVHQPVNGGRILTVDNQNKVEVVIGDGQADRIAFDSIGASPAAYVFLVTDAENVVQAIMPANAYDFEGGAAGICRVWGLSYTGRLEVQIGTDLDDEPLSDDCFDLTDNFVEVIKSSNFGDPVPEEETFERDEAATTVELSAWPNPVDDLLRVRIERAKPASPTQGWLRIFSANGQLVSSRLIRVVDAVEIVEVAVADLKPGLYLVQWRDGDQLQTTRFVKSRD